MIKLNERRLRHEYLSLLDGLSVEEGGKLVLGERNQLIQNKMQELRDSLLESEICEFFEDASNATEGNSIVSRRISYGICLWQ